MSEFKVLKCSVCGKTAIVLSGDCCPTVCCGKPMEELIPGSTDAAQEKHVPVITRQDGWLEVNIGSVDHPMTPEHYIVWVALVTENGFTIAHLHPGDKPHVRFPAVDDAKAVYAYCNLHGLWKADL